METLKKVLLAIDVMSLAGAVVTHDVRFAIITLITGAAALAITIKE